MMPARVAITAGAQGTIFGGNMNGNLRGGATALALLLCGCASVSPQQRSYYDQQAQHLRSQPMAIVADSCILRDEIGDDYVLRQATQQIGEQVTQALSSHLTAAGYQVRRTSTPFLCGYLSGAMPNSEIADAAGGSRSSVQLPVVLATDLQADALGSAAYRNLLTRSIETKDTSSGKEPAAVPLELNATEAALLRTRLGASRVWVLHYGGVEVSTGKSIGVALLTSALTLGATGGAAGFYSFPISGAGYTIALVDLDERQILWKKQVGAQQGGGQPTQKNWAANMLDPFMVASDGVVSGAAAPAAPDPASTPALAAPPAQVTAAPTASPAAIPAAYTATPPAAAALPAPPRPQSAAIPAVASTTANRVLVQASALRSAPTAESTVLQTLPAGSEVTVVSNLDNGMGRWLFVRWNGRSGWVQQDGSSVTAN